MQNDQELKKIYLRLARKYHPDVAKTGDKITFQQVQQAYERLKAEREGYTLTEEDLQDMYASQMGNRYRRQRGDRQDEPEEE